MGEKVRRTAEEWRQQLTAEQYRVTREHGTERAFTGEYHATKDHGIYRCACCGADRFATDAKVDSGSGWPSFTSPSGEEAIETDADTSLGMRRTEVHCARCDAHLGHVFDDGPAPTGKRYCINSASLSLDRKP